MKKGLIIIQSIAVITLILSSIIFIYYGVFADYSNYPLGSLGAMEKLFIPLIIMLVCALALIITFIIRKSIKIK